jgi:prolyl-tRNA synthetase
MPGKEGKQILSQDNIAAQISDLLHTIQANMLAQATAFRDANTQDVKTYDEMQQVVEVGGFARGWWSGSDDDEAQVKTETQATNRCFPLEQPDGSGVCFYTGKPAQRFAIFAKAY